LKAKSWNGKKALATEWNDKHGAYRVKLRCDGSLKWIKPINLALVTKKVSTRGTLVFTSLQANNIKCKDNFSSGDPYLIIKHKKDKIKTEVKSGKNPKWAETFNFNVDDPSDTVVFELFDWDRFSSDDKIGSATKPVSFFQKTEGNSSLEIPLDTRGSVKLNVEWRPEEN